MSEHKGVIEIKAEITDNFKNAVRRPDAIDWMVFFATLNIRRMYHDVCERLHQQPRILTPVTIMQRSVPE